MEETELKNLVTTFVKKLFTEEAHSCDMTNCKADRLSLLSMVDWHNLNRQFTSDEVKAVLNSMQPLSVTGLDGFHAMLF